jgi:HEAT repeat protein/glycosyltransferase involved in cell wall biosynthesis
MMDRNNPPEPGILPENPKLSVCMIVRDEEETLPRCLKSVQRIADELIIVDTGSRDNTISIVREYGGKVFHFEWCDDYSAARNESLKHATGDWILQIDADEELPDCSVNLLKQAMLDPWCLLWVITCNDIYVEADSQKFGPVPRLFRNHRSVNYTGTYHEMVTLHVKNIMTYEPLWEQKRSPDLIIHHYGFEVQDTRQKSKVSRSIQIMEDYLNKNPDDTHMLLMLGDQYSRAGRYDETIACIQKAKSLIAEAPQRFLSGTSFYLPTELPPWYHYILGSAYYAKGLWHESAAECQTALSLDPFDEDVRQLLDRAGKATGIQNSSIQQSRVAHMNRTDSSGNTDKRYVEDLIETLHDPDWGIRREAAKALAEIGDTDAIEPLTEILHDEYGDRIGAAWALGGIKDARAASPLIEALQGEEWYFSWGIRWAVTKALAKIGLPAVTPLIEALGHDQSGVRWGAAWALGKIADPKAISPLIGTLQDENDCVREEAAKALGIAGYTEVIRPLVHALQDNYCGVRRNAARSLGKTGDSAVIEPLLTALKDTDWDVRRHAANALGVIRNPRGARGLVELLSDQYRSVREEAAKALGSIGGKEAAAL